MKWEQSITYRLLVFLERMDSLEGHPSSAVLLVEVAESSLMYDRTTKASIYAQAQIAEYWMVFPADVAMGFTLKRMEFPVGEGCDGRYCDGLFG